MYCQEWPTNAEQLLRTTLDQDSAAPKPGDLTSYQAAHKDWFTTMYSAGIKKLQEQYVDAATYLTHPDRATEYAALPLEIRTAINPLTVGDEMAAAKNLCGGAFVYP